MLEVSARPTQGPLLAQFAQAHIRHTKGRWRGQPVVWDDWQNEFWDEALEVDPATGLRVYQRVLLLVPRKNGKSTMIGVSCCYLLTVDGYTDPSSGEWRPEGSPEVYAAAGSKPQAGIVFRQSKAFIEYSPTLRDVVRVRQYDMQCPENDGIFQVLSSDAPRHHGLNPSGVAIDELHAHHDDTLLVALVTATAAREQPLVVIISTEGVDDEGPLAAMVDDALKLPDQEQRRPGLIVARDRANGFLAYIYKPDDDADPEDPAVWAMVNPSPWVTEQVLRSEKSMPGFRLADFMRYHLNMRVPTEQPWLPPGTWSRLVARGQDEDTPDLAAISRRAVTLPSGTYSDDVVLAKLDMLDPDLPIGVGIDMGKMYDSTGVVVCQRQGDRALLVSRAWENPWPDNHPAHDTWRVNQAEVRAYLRLLHGAFQAPMANREVGRKGHKRLKPWPGPAFAYDPWHFSESAEMLEGEIEANMVEFPQYASRMVPASETFYELATTDRLRHDNDVVLARHIGNAVALLTDRGWRISKGKNPRKRVDLAVATAMSIAMGMADPPEIRERRRRTPVGF